MSIILTSEQMKSFEDSAKKALIDLNVINKQKKEMLKLENIIVDMKSEIVYALNENKSEEVKKHYLENAVRYADKAIFIE